MIILAFDLGRETGVAYGNVRDIPKFQTEFLGKVGSTQAARFSQTLRMCNRLIGEIKPDAIVIEKPIAAGVVGKEARVQQAFGYRGCIFAMAQMKGIKPYEYSVQDIRGHMLGERNLKSEIAKPRAFEACKRLGWNPATYDESDAGAVWHFARMKIGGVTTLPGLFGDQLHG